MSYHFNSRYIIAAAGLFVLVGQTFAANPGTFGDMFVNESGAFKFRGDKIRDNTVSSTELASDSIISSKIASGSVMAEDVDKTQIQLRTGGIACASPDEAIVSVDENGNATCIKIAYPGGAVTPPPTSYSCSIPVPPFDASVDLLTLIHSASSSNQAWTYGGTSCGYKCASGYVYSGKSAWDGTNCTPDVKTCAGSVPTNADVDLTSSTYSANLGNFSWGKPAGTSGYCKFSCKTGFLWDDVQGACIPSAPGLVDGKCGTFDSMSLPQQPDIVTDKSSLCAQGDPVSLQGPPQGSWIWDCKGTSNNVAKCGASSSVYVWKNTGNGTTWGFRPDQLGEKNEPGYVIANFEHPSRTKWCQIINDFKGDSYWRNPKLPGDTFTMTRSEWKSNPNYQPPISSWGSSYIYFYKGFWGENGGGASICNQHNDRATFDFSIYEFQKPVDQYCDGTLPSNAYSTNVGTRGTWHLGSTAGTCTYECYNGWGGDQCEQDLRTPGTWVCDPSVGSFTCCQDPVWGKECEGSPTTSCHKDPNGFIRDGDVCGRNGFVI